MTSSAFFERALVFLVLRAAPLALSPVRRGTVDSCFEMAMPALTAASTDFSVSAPFALSGSNTPAVSCSGARYFCATRCKSSGVARLSV